MQNGFRFFRQVSKHRRANDQEKILEERKIHDQKYDPDRKTHQQKEEIHPSVLQLFHPHLQRQQVQHIINEYPRIIPDEINAGNEKYAIDDARHVDPLPQPVLCNELMRFGV